MRGWCGHVVRHGVRSIKEGNTYVNLTAAGTTLVDEEVEVAEATLAAVASALGSTSAYDTATLVPFFAPMIQGDAALVRGLGVDYSKLLLGGLSYEWHRPFRPGE